MISTRAFARVGRAVSLLATPTVKVFEKSLADRVRLRIFELYVYLSLHDSAGIKETFHISNLIKTAIEGQELRHCHR